MDLCIKHQKADVADFWTEKHPEIMLADSGNPMTGPVFTAPLNNAITEGKLDVLKHLMEWTVSEDGGKAVLAERFANTEEYLSLGNCPSPEVVRYAVAKGADVNRAHKGFPTAMGKAFISVFQLKARLGSDDQFCLAMALTPGMTPLHEAAFWGNFAVACELLKLGADPRATCDMGWTPLDVARMMRFSHIEQELERALKKFPAPEEPAPWYACCAAAAGGELEVVTPAADEVAKKGSKESSSAATTASA